MALIDKETWDNIPDNTKYEACETMLGALMCMCSVIGEIQDVASAGEDRLRQVNNTFKELSNALQESKQAGSEEDSSQEARCGSEAAEREELAGD